MGMISPEGYSENLKNESAEKIMWHFIYSNVDIPGHEEILTGEVCAETEEEARVEAEKLFMAKFNKKGIGSEHISFGLISP
jgi:hypothetical protein